MKLNLNFPGGELINFCLNCIKNCQEVLEDNFSSNYKSVGWPWLDSPNEGETPQI